MPFPLLNQFDEELNRLKQIGVQSKVGYSEIFVKLNNGKLLSKIDLCDAYLQTPVDATSLF